MRHHDKLAIHFVQAEYVSSSSKCKGVCRGVTWSCGCLGIRKVEREGGGRREKLTYILGNLLPQTLFASVRDTDAGGYQKITKILDYGIPIPWT